MKLTLGIVAALALLAGVVILRGGSELQSRASGRPDPDLGVEAAPGECVTMHYASGIGKAPTPERALLARYPKASGAARSDVSAREVVFRLYEDGRTDAGFRVIDTGGGWFVVQASHSYPCGRSNELPPFVDVGGG